MFDILAKIWNDLTAALFGRDLEAKKIAVRSTYSERRLPWEDQHRR